MLILEEVANFGQVINWYLNLGSRFNCLSSMTVLIKNFLFLDSSADCDIFLCNVVWVCGIILDSTIFHVPCHSRTALGFDICEPTLRPAYATHLGLIQLFQRLLMRTGRGITLFVREMDFGISPLQRDEFMIPYFNLRESATGRRDLL